MTEKATKAVRTYYTTTNLGRNIYYKSVDVRVFQKSLLLQNCNRLKITVIQEWCFTAHVQTLVLTPVR